MSKRVPLQDVLRYALEFAETKPVTPSCSSTQDVEMESPKSQSEYAFHYDREFMVMTLLIKL